MRTALKLLALFYGVQFLLGGIGMGLYCFLSENPFPFIGKDQGIDFRLLFLTAGLLPQVGIGILLIVCGLPSRVRSRSYRHLLMMAKDLV
jgi:hypothetical protein